MKKTKVFYPPLFAAFPVLSIFSANLSLCPLSDLWKPLAGSVIGSLILWLIFSAVFRKVEKGAVAAVVWTGSFYLFSTFLAHSIISKLIFSDVSRSWFFANLALWAVLTLAISIFAAKLWKWPKALNTLGIFLVISSSVTIILGYQKISNDERKLTKRLTAAGNPIEKGARPPDVFYIILDGYGRIDQLARALHYDNTSFINELKNRGFYVAADSHSNYVQTEISLSSSLNTDLIPNLIIGFKPDDGDRAPFDSLVDRNSVTAHFRALGYTTATVTSGFPAFFFKLPDLNLREPQKVSLFEGAILQMTPFGTTTEEVDSMFEQRHDTLLGAFQNLKDLASPVARPRFVFAHILAPHPPFVFDKDGNTPKHHMPFGFWDGSDYELYGGSKEEYRIGYIGQVQYLNTQILALIDTILQKQPQKPLILLQGDHGSKLNLDQNSLQKTDVEEAFSNLAAFSVPDSVKSKLYPSITPVNSFRVIFNALFGEKNELRPDRSWYSPFEHPFEFTDVTDAIRKDDPMRDSK